MRILFCLCLCLLSGCTSLTPPPARNQALGWQQRLTQLQQISHWTLQGTVGIRTSEKAWSASLLWQQKPTDYALHLFGPLGVSRIQLIGSADQVTLSTPSEPMMSAKNPEILLQKALGWQLPVSHLQYWVRGIPAPHQPARYTWDKFHHLSQLEQDNWQISYTEYSNSNGIDLPTRISLQHDKLQIRLVIRQWQH